VNRFGSIYCLSFDTRPVSGIVEECLKLAHAFHQRGVKVYFDPGYEITPDSEYFGLTQSPAASFPAWVHRTGIDALGTVPGYTHAFLLELLRDFVREDGTRSAHLSRRVEELAVALSERIMHRWRELDVRFVLIENGTLPDNLVYTHALRRALVIYGRERGLGRYALWRDHDLMWFCLEGKYGSHPYPVVPRPLRSPCVRHVVTTERARKRVVEWAGHAEIEVLPYYHTFAEHAGRRSGRLREQLGIPLDAFLIARCSRVVPAKRIDRDILLLARLREMAATKGITRDYHLFVTGPLSEDPSEAARLRALAIELGVEPFVTMADGLRSFESFTHGDQPPGPSVRDLLDEADLSSFLTSFGYEGFGLPPGEAIASRIPYTCTTYEMYDEAYGSSGFLAPLLPISRSSDGPPTPEFTARIFEFLLDAAEREAYGGFNYVLGKRLLSIEALEQKLEALLPAFGMLRDEESSVIRPPGVTS
jgi:hypothetical protein